MYTGFQKHPFWHVPNHMPSLAENMKAKQAEPKQVSKHMQAKYTPENYLVFAYRMQLAQVYPKNCFPGTQFRG